uniref:Glycosyl transferase family 25 domain-containing protein n=1 Tax=Rhodosorus marinus TaxID=101924 RepID=A0A7S2ZQ69_9RHOD|mmetsp:Transcript_26471/g.103109  ORF Transcript_26471/g.103109 Transcript_26471/m.103109 type:complete len:400 (+) Transcript_26471:187-1386(+)
MKRGWKSLRIKHATHRVDLELGKTVRGRAAPSGIRFGRIDADDNVRKSRAIRITLWCALLSFIILISIFALGLGHRKSGSEYGGSLPYPFTIVAEVQSRGGLKWSTSGKNKPPTSFPAGYVGVRPGTFRDPLSSESANRYGAFDEMFVLTSPKCPHQLDVFKKKADQQGLRFQTINQYSKEFSLESPPIPIRLDKSLNDLSHRERVSLRRDVSYALTHLSIWKRMVDLGLQRVLIIDDTLFISAKLAEVLPDLFARIDQESVGGSLTWHVIYFRRMIMDSAAGSNNESAWEGPEGKWTSNPSFHHPIVRAKPSYGAGAYAVSLHGARWLYNHLTEYKVPIDNQLCLFQREHRDEFVALSACGNDQPKDFCPENVEVLLDDRDSDECRWRRLQERKLSKC